LNLKFLEPTFEVSNLSIASKHNPSNDSYKEPKRPGKSNDSFINKDFGAVSSSSSEDRQYCETERVVAFSPLSVKSKSIEKVVKSKPAPIEIKKS